MSDYIKVFLFVDFSIYTKLHLNFVISIKSYAMNALHFPKHFSLDYFKAKTLEPCKACMVSLNTLKLDFCPFRRVPPVFAWRTPTHVRPEGRSDIKPLYR